MTTAEYFYNNLDKLKEVTYGQMPLADNIKELIELWAELPHIIMLGGEGRGIIMGILHRHFYNPSILICSEMVWYGETPRQALELLHELEEKAKEFNVDYIIIGNGYGKLDTSKASKLGYEKFEVSYRKVLE